MDSSLRTFRARGGEPPPLGLKLRQRNLWFQGRDAL